MYMLNIKNVEKKFALKQSPSHLRATSLFHIGSMKSFEYPSMYFWHVLYQ